MIELENQEIEKLREINRRYNTVIFETGQLSIEIENTERSLLELKKDKENLYNDYEKIKEEEEIIAEKLTKKYGQGRIDLEKGIIYG